MRRVLLIVCTTLAVVGMFVYRNLPKEPKLISSITVMDTTYLTILADKTFIENEQMLEECILRMCMEDTFENIKLNTQDRQLTNNLHISVYLSKKDLESGRPYMIIKNEAEE